jgi:hypothetical protein
LSFCFGFKFFLLFLCLLLAFAGLLLLDDLLELFWLFGLLVVLHGVLDSNFKLRAFIVNGLVKGEIEKPSGQFLRLIVMSH